jgi:hypothetical protein
MPEPTQTPQRILSAHAIVAICSSHRRSRIPSRSKHTACQSRIAHEDGGAE